MRGRREETFDPVRVSPNRVNQYLSCGEAFQRNYIQGEPEEMSGSAALFGSVVHAALEHWAMNRQADLTALVRSAWLDVTKEAPTVNAFIVAYQAMAGEIIRAEKECADAFEARQGRPTKAVRMTGEWKKHPASGKVSRFLGEWLPKLKDSPWRFNERDPLPALYNESLILSKRYQARWQHLPNAWYSELGFTVNWRGFILHGYIDSIEPVQHRDTGELLGIGVVDYKTYAKAPAPAKDWRQRAFYDAAIRDLLSTGQLELPVKDLPIYVGMDYVRWTDSWLDESEKYPTAARVWEEMTDADRDLLERDLTMYRDGVTHGVFLPAEKGRNPDFCPYPSNCCLKNRGERKAELELVT